MNTEELQALAKRSRFMREAGTALFFSSLILAAFLFVPLASRSKDQIVSPVSSQKSSSDPFANASLRAKAAVVQDLVTGEILFEKNADAQLPLASLTKLLTVYAALVELSPKTPITISAEATSREIPRRFREGETLELQDLARLTLTASLNDGAAALQEELERRKGVSFNSALANVTAALGLSQTFALNGSGLDENSSVAGAYGSARDMAELARALVETAPAIASATTEASVTAISAGGRLITATNTNPTAVHTARLLLSKTGFTDLAGGNLAIVFDAGIAYPVAVIVLGSSEKERFTDARTLVAATLAHFADIVSL